MQVFHSSFLFLTLFMLADLGFGADPLVNYQGGRILAQPPKGMKIEGENIEILNTIECGAKAESRNSIQVPKNCRYLHGLYRYIFLPAKEFGVARSKQQALVDFALTLDSKGGQTFLVGETLQIDQGQIPSIQLN